MNIGQIQADLKTALVDMYEPDEALAITEMVLEHFIGKTRVQQKLESKLELDQDKIDLILSAKQQLKTNKPVQYVLGSAWFMGLPFLVDESVLIPRPETEELVMLAIENVEKKAFSILDIGTGSGCIPIMLQKRMPAAKITSVDISGAALVTAQKNAVKYQVAIDFRKLDFLDETAWGLLPIFDVVVSNPPYIPIKEKDILDKNVTLWEPGLALFVPDDDPLLFYRKIALFAKKHLAQNGKIFVEVHQDFAMETQKMFEENGYAAILKKDINGNDRMLMVTNIP